MFNTAPLFAQSISSIQRIIQSVSVCVSELVSKNVCEKPVSCRPTFSIWPSCSLHTRSGHTCSSLPIQ